MTASCAAPYPNVVPVRLTLRHQRLPHRCQRQIYQLVSQGATCIRTLFETRCICITQSSTVHIDSVPLPCDDA